MGKPGGRASGYVDRPYTMTDLKDTLAAVSGDARFADDFFARFIQGRDVVNYGRLLARAGFALRLAAPGRAFAGQLRLQDVRGRPRVTAAVPFGSPAYQAGLERDDVILAVAGEGRHECGRLRSCDQPTQAWRPGRDPVRAARTARDRDASPGRGPADRDRPGPRPRAGRFPRSSDSSGTPGYARPRGTCSKALFK